LGHVSSRAEGRITETREIFRRSRGGSPDRDPQRLPCEASYRRGHELTAKP